MSGALLKLCAWNYCRKAIPRGWRFCARHERAYRAGRQHRPIEAIYHSRRWLTKTRPAVLERDGWRCVFCGATSRLQVAHVAPTRLLLAAGLDVHDPALCVTTCPSHNEAASRLATVDRMAGAVVFRDDSGGRFARGAGAGWSGRDGGRDLRDRPPLGVVARS